MAKWYCVQVCYHPASYNSTSHRRFKVGEVFEAPDHVNMHKDFWRKEKVETPVATVKEVRDHPAYRKTENKRGMPASEYFKKHDKASFKKVEVKHVGFGRYDVLVNENKINKGALNKKEAEKLASEQ